MRFSLSNLLLAVALIAVACAGLMSHSNRWAGGIITLTVLIYAVAAIRIISFRGRDRAIAVAFFVVGMSYIVLITSNLLPTVRDLLYTNNTLEFAYEFTSKSEAEAKPNFAPDYPWHHLGWLFDGGNEAMSRRRNFVLIGHCIWSWVFALLAGWLSSVLFTKSQIRQMDEPLATSESELKTIV